jgi:P-type Ca2+ transporter type 2C
MRGTSLASNSGQVIGRLGCRNIMSTPASGSTHGTTPFRYHAWPVEEVLTALQSSPRGLTEAEATRRLDQYGPNRLAPPVPASALRILRDQLTGIVVLLLVVAAVVSLVLGDRMEAIAIAAVLVINTVIGFSTELRARRAMEALLQLDSSRASVTRDGVLRTLGAEHLVPGDIIRLNAGERVPADARLLDAAELRTDEAALTGESLPTSKRPGDRLPDDAALADRTTMVYKGTIVSAGTAAAVVSATGAATEIGRVGLLMAGIEEKPTPLQVRLDALGRRLAWIAIVVAALVTALAAIQGAPLALVLEMGIALAVAAVPEALPAVATIAMAVGMRRMAHRRALVRRLPAVEALGSTTVVCTDKTRTLTTGHMTVVRLWTAGTDFRVTDDTDSFANTRVRHALEVAVLACQPQPIAVDGARGGVDPVDRAILTAGVRAGIDRTPLVQQRPQTGLLPFSSARKLMASFHQVDESFAVYAKGAPRQILDVTDSVAIDGAVQPLDDEGRHQLMAVNDALARDGLRVLALAMGPATASAIWPPGPLTFVGFVGLADPPAPGVKETIAQLQRAGLR